MLVNKLVEIVVFLLNIYFSSNGKFGRQKYWTMVWSEYNCSSTSVEEIYFLNNYIFIYLSRRIASNEFDKQVHVHVAMDNTLILDEIR
jgi:uncharacterized membrane protein YhaH (DUF805 family)